MENQRISEAYTEFTGRKSIIDRFHVDRKINKMNKWDAVTK